MNRKPTVSYSLKLYSLPRVAPFIKEALSKFPTHSNIVDYSATQSRGCDSSSTGLHVLHNAQLKKYYKKLVLERYSSEHGYETDLNFINNILSLGNPTLDEYESIFLAISDSKKYSNILEGLAAVEHMIATLDSHDILITSGSHLEIVDDYLLNTVKLVFSVPVAANEYRIDLVNPKTGETLASKVYTTDPSARNKNNEFRYSLVTTTPSWDAVLAPIRDSILHEDLDFDDDGGDDADSANDDPSDSSVDSLTEEASYPAPEFLPPVEDTAASTTDLSNNSWFTKL